MSTWFIISCIYTVILSTHVLLSRNQFWRISNGKPHFRGGPTSYLRQLLFMKTNSTTDSPFLTLSVIKWPRQKALTTYTFHLWVSFTFAVTSPKGHLIPNLPVCILSSRSINGPINLLTWEKMAGGQESRSDMCKPQTQRNTEAPWRFHSKGFLKALRPAGKIIGEQNMPILAETWHMPTFKFKR